MMKFLIALLLAYWVWSCWHPEQVAVYQPILPAAPTPTPEPLPSDHWGPAQFLGQGELPPVGPNEAIMLEFKACKTYQDPKKPDLYGDLKGGTRYDGFLKNPYQGTLFDLVTNQSFYIFRQSANGPTTWYSRDMYETVPDWEEAIRPMPQPQQTTTTSDRGVHNANFTGGIYQQGYSGHIGRIVEDENQGHLYLRQSRTSWAHRTQRQSVRHL